MALTLSEPDVAKVLKYERLIPAMEKALSAFSAGRVIQPVRNLITIEEGKRFLGIMPAVAEDGMGAKLVCFFPKNAGTKVLQMSVRLNSTSKQRQNFAALGGEVFRHCCRDRRGSHFGNEPSVQER